MIAYLFILFVVAALCLLKPSKQKKYAPYAVLAMLFMCGFRGEDVGVDTFRYIEYGEGSDVLGHSWGPVFVFLRYISSFFGNSGQAFLFFMALLTYAPLFYIVNKHSEKPALSLLMFIIPSGMFFFETFNLARQSISIVIVLYSAILLHHGFYKWSILSTILSFIVHPYSVIFVLFYLFNYIKFKRQHIIPIVLGSIVIGLIGTISQISDAINMVSMFVGDSSSDFILKLGKYKDYDIVSGFSIIGQLSHMLPLSLLCIIGANDETVNNTYYKMMLLGCIITNLFVSVIFCERFASTFTVAQVLAVPMIYSCIRQTKLVTILLVFTGLLYIYNLKQLSNDVMLFSPYHFFWD